MLASSQGFQARLRSCFSSKIDGRDVVRVTKVSAGIVARGLLCLNVVFLVISIFAGRNLPETGANCANPQQILVIWVTLDNALNFLGISCILSGLFLRKSHEKMQGLYVAQKLKRENKAEFDRKLSEFEQETNKELEERRQGSKRLRELMRYGQTGSQIQGQATEVIEKRTFNPAVMTEQHKAYLTNYEKLQRGMWDSPHKGRQTAVDLQQDVYSLAFASLYCSADPLENRQAVANSALCFICQVLLTYLYSKNPIDQASNSTLGSLESNLTKVCSFFVLHFLLAPSVRSAISMLHHSLSQTNDFANHGPPHAYLIALFKAASTLYIHFAFLFSILSSLSNEQCLTMLVVFVLIHRIGFFFVDLSESPKGDVPKLAGRRVDGRSIITIHYEEYKEGGNSCLGMFVLLIGDIVYLLLRITFNCFYFYLFPILVIFMILNKVY